jgi:hypothetical protein
MRIFLAVTGPKGAVAGEQGGAVQEGASGRWKQVDLLRRAAGFGPTVESPPSTSVVVHAVDADDVKGSPLAVNPTTGKSKDLASDDPATPVHPRFRNVFFAGDVAGSRPARQRQRHE